MLGCVVLCCAVLCWVVICCVVLCCAVLCWVVMCCVVLCCTLQLEGNAGGGDKRIHQSPHPSGSGVQLAVHCRGNTPSVCTHLSDGDCGT